MPTALCPVITVKDKRLHALAHYAAFRNGRQANSFVTATTMAAGMKF